MTLYEELKASGVPVTNHESDLYFMATPEAIDILKRYPMHYKQSQRFLHNQDKVEWVDVPFAYDPFWNRHASK